MVGLAENLANQPSLAGAWAELGNILVSSCLEVYVLAGCR